jgi:hypothetical protein
MVGQMVILSKTFHGQKLKKYQTSVFTGPFVSMEEIAEETSIQNHGKKERSHQNDVWESLNATTLPSTSLFGPKRHLKEFISSSTSLAAVVPCLNIQSAMLYDISSQALVISILFVVLLSPKYNNLYTACY